MLENMEMNDIFEQNIKQNIKKNVKIIHTLDTNKTTIRTCIELSFLLFSVDLTNKSC